MNREPKQEDPAPKEGKLLEGTASGKSPSQDRTVPGMLAEQKASPYGLNQVRKGERAGSEGRAVAVMGERGGAHKGQL